MSRFRTTRDNCLADIGAGGNVFVIEIANKIFVMFVFRYCKGGVESGGTRGHGDSDCKSCKVECSRCVSCISGVVRMMCLRVCESVDCFRLCVCIRVSVCGSCNKRVAIRNVSSGSTPVTMMGGKGAVNFMRLWPHFIGEGRVGVAKISAWSEKFSGRVMIEAVLQRVVVYILSNLRAV